MKAVYRRLIQRIVAFVLAFMLAGSPLTEIALAGQITDYRGQRAEGGWQMSDDVFVADDREFVGPDVEDDAVNISGNIVNIGGFAGAASDGPYEVVPSAEGIAGQARNDGLHDDDLHDDGLFEGIAGQARNDDLHDDGLHDDDLRDDDLFEGIAGQARNDDLPLALGDNFVPFAEPTYMPNYEPPIEPEPQVDPEPQYPPIDPEPQDPPADPGPEYPPAEPGPEPDCSECGQEPCECITDPPEPEVCPDCGEEDCDGDCEDVTEPAEPEVCEECEEEPCVCDTEPAEPEICEECEEEPCVCYPEENECECEEDCDGLECGCENCPSDEEKIECECEEDCDGEECDCEDCPALEGGPGLPGGGFPVPPCGNFDCMCLHSEDCIAGFCAEDCLCICNLPPCLDPDCECEHHPDCTIYECHEDCECECRRVLPVTVLSMDLGQPLAPSMSFQIGTRLEWERFQYALSLPSGTAERWPYQIFLRHGPGTTFEHPLRVTETIVVPEGRQLWIQNGSLLYSGPAETPMFEVRGMLSIGNIQLQSNSGRVAEVHGGGTFIPNPDGLTEPGTFANGLFHMRHNGSRVLGAHGGGGVTVFSGGRLRMDDGRISGASGSGVDVRAGGEFAFGGGTIENVTGGPGVNVAGGATLTMTGGTIQNNTNANGRGGGIHIGGYTPPGIATIGGPARIANNTAGIGGGIYNNGTLTIEGNAVIEGNTATVTSPGTDNIFGGGGIFNFGGGSTVTMTGGTIRNNQVGDGTQGNGGGVNLRDGTFTMSGGLILENFAQHGGGVSLSGHNARLNLSSTAVIENNFSVNGNGAGVFVNASGGSGGLNMTGGSIRNNTAMGNINQVNPTGGGGGVHLTNAGAAVNISGGTISGNTAERGGGVFAHGALTLSGTAEITNNRARDTRHSSNGLWAVGGGGGVFVHGANFTMDGGTISNNRAEADDGTFGPGGGVQIFNVAFTMNGGTISGNNALDGGGVSLNTHTSARLNFNGGTIENNTARNRGGGVIANGVAGVGWATLSINSGATRAVIRGNTALGGQGGGVYIGHSAALSTSGDFLIEGNRAIGGSEPSGGGIFFASGGAVTINSGTISGNWNSVADTGINAATGNGRGGGIFTNRGLTIAGTAAITGNHSRDGGGIYIPEGIAFSMTGGSVNENFLRQASQGGGIMLRPGPLVTISGGQINNNRATAGSQGGGIRAVRNLTIGGSAVIEGNEVAAGSGSQGAGVSMLFVTATGAPSNFILEGNARISNNIVHGNEAGNSGGGVRLGPGEHHIRGDAVISGNQAAQGGGVWLQGTGGAGATRRLTVSGDATINNNNARMSGSVIGGGGIRAEAGTILNISGGTIRNNTAANDGGGIFTQGAFVLSGGEIRANHSSAAGGGVFQSGGSFEMTGGRIGGAENPPASGDITSANAGNRAAWGGGGLYLTGGPASLSITGGEISHNMVTRAHVDAYGGGIASHHSLTIGGGTVIRNNGFASPAHGRGGGVFVRNGAVLTVNFAGANNAGHIRNNSALRGGGIAAEQANVTLSGNTTLRGNAAPSGSGGGIEMLEGAWSRTLTIEGSTQIVQNSAANGGGVSVRGTNTTLEMTGGIIGWTGDGGGTNLQGNTATGDGGGLLLANNVTANLRGGSINGNVAARGGGMLVMNTATANLLGAHFGHVGAIPPGGGANNIGANTVAPNRAVGGHGGGIAQLGGTINMTAGMIRNSHASQGGGGVFISGGTFNFDDGTIGDLNGHQAQGVFALGNRTTGDAHGGGVYITGTGAFHMRNNAQILRNWTNNGHGGGVHLAGGSFTMHGENVRINNNHARGTGAGGGGGINITGGTFTLSGEIHDNQAHGPGGGGGVRIAGGASHTIAGTTLIRNNTANQNGGGLALNSTGTTLAIDGSATIRNNTANQGGGVWLNDGTLNVAGGARIGQKPTFTQFEAGEANPANNREGFMGNIASLRGGGVHITGGTLNLSGSARIEGNNVSDANIGPAHTGASRHGGGGVFVSNGGVFNMTETSQVSRNTGPSGAGISIAGGHGANRPGAASISGNASVNRNIGRINDGGIFIAPGINNMPGGLLQMSGGEIYANISRGWGSAIRLDRAGNNANERARFEMSGGNIHRHVTGFSTVVIHGDMVMTGSDTFIQDNDTNLNATLPADILPVSRPVPDGAGALHFGAGGQFIMGEHGEAAAQGPSIRNNTNHNTHGGGIDIQIDHPTDRNQPTRVDLRSGNITGNKAATHGGGISWNPVNFNHETSKLPNITYIGALFNISGNTAVAGEVTSGPMWMILNAHSPENMALGEPGSATNPGTIFTPYETNLFNNHNIRAESQHFLTVLDGYTPASSSVTTITVIQPRIGDDGSPTGGTIQTEVGSGQRAIVPYGTQVDIIVQGRGRGSPGAPHGFRWGGWTGTPEPGMVSAPGGLGMEANVGETNTFRITMPGSSVDLTANWVQQFRVFINPRRPVGEAAEQSSVTYHVAGDLIELVRAGASPQGWQFEGWEITGGHAGIDLANVAGGAVALYPNRTNPTRDINFTFPAAGRDLEILGHWFSTEASVTLTNAWARDDYPALSTDKTPERWARITDQFTQLGDGDKNSIPDENQPPNGQPSLMAIMDVNEDLTLNAGSRRGHTFVGWRFDANNTDINEGGTNRRPITIGDFTGFSVDGSGFITHSGERVGIELVLPFPADIDPAQAGPIFTAVWERNVYTITLENTRVDSMPGWETPMARGFSIPDLTGGNNWTREVYYGELVTINAGAHLQDRHRFYGWTANGGDTGYHAVPSLNVTQADVMVFTAEGIAGQARNDGLGGLIEGIAEPAPYLIRGQARNDGSREITFTANWDFNRQGVTIVNWTDRLEASPREGEAETYTDTYTDPIAIFGFPVGHSLTFGTTGVEAITDVPGVDFPGEIRDLPSEDVFFDGWAITPNNLSPTFADDGHRVTITMPDNANVTAVAQWIGIAVQADDREFGDVERPEEPPVTAPPSIIAMSAAAFPTLDFGDIETGHGTLLRDRTLTIINTGNVPLETSRLTFSNQTDFSIDSSSLPTTIPAGGRAHVTVRPNAATASVTRNIEILADTNPEGGTNTSNLLATFTATVNIVAREFFRVNFAAAEGSGSVEAFIEGATPGVFDTQIVSGTSLERMTNVRTVLTPSPGHHVSSWGESVSNESGSASAGPGGWPLEANTTEPLTLEWSVGAGGLDLTASFSPNMRGFTFDVIDMENAGILGGTASWSYIDAHGQTVTGGGTTLDVTLPFGAEVTITALPSDDPATRAYQWTRNYEDGNQQGWVQVGELYETFRPFTMPDWNKGARLQFEYVGHPIHFLNMPDSLPAGTGTESGMDIFGQVIPASAHGGREITINAGVRPGYVFAGWTGLPGGVGGDEREITFTMPNEGIDALRANWVSFIEPGRNGIVPVLQGELRPPETYPDFNCICGNINILHLGTAVEDYGEDNIESLHTRTIIIANLHDEVYLPPITVSAGTEGLAGEDTGTAAFEFEISDIDVIDPAGRIAALNLPPNTIPPLAPGEFVTITITPPEGLAVEDMQHFHNPISGGGLAHRGFIVLTGQDGTEHGTPLWHVRTDMIVAAVDTVDIMVNVADAVNFGAVVEFRENGGPWGPPRDPPDPTGTLASAEPFAGNLVHANVPIDRIVEMRVTLEYGGAISDFTVDGQNKIGDANFSEGTDNATVGGVSLPVRQYTFRWDGALYGGELAADADEFGIISVGVVIDRFAPSLNIRHYIENTNLEPHIHQQSTRDWPFDINVNQGGLGFADAFNQIQEHGATFEPFRFVVRAADETGGGEGGPRRVEQDDPVFAPGDMWWPVDITAAASLNALSGPFATSFHMPGEDTIFEIHYQPLFTLTVQNAKRGIMLEAPQGGANVPSAPTSASSERMLRGGAQVFSLNIDTYSTIKGWRVASPLDSNNAPLVNIADVISGAGAESYGDQNSIEFYPQGSNMDDAEYIIVTVRIPGNMPLAGALIIEPIWDIDIHQIDLFDFLHSFGLEANDDNAPILHENLRAAMPEIYSGTQIRLHTGVNLANPENNVVVTGVGENAVIDIFIRNFPGYTFRATDGWEALRVTGTGSNNEPITEPITLTPASGEDWEYSFSMPDFPVIIRAHYDRRIHALNVSYNTWRGGTNTDEISSEAERQVPFQRYVVLNAVPETPTGYVFHAWRVGADTIGAAPTTNTTNVFPDPANPARTFRMLDLALDIRAYFVPLQYTVTIEQWLFDTAGGVFVQQDGEGGTENWTWTSGNVDYNSAFIHTVPLRPGFVFDGWDAAEVTPGTLAPTFNDAARSVGFDMPNEAVTLRANWRVFEDVVGPPVPPEPPVEPPVNPTDPPEPPGGGDSHRPDGRLHSLDLGEGVVGRYHLNSGIADNHTRTVGLASVHEHPVPVRFAFEGALDAFELVPPSGGTTDATTGAIIFNIASGAESNPVTTSFTVRVRRNDLPVHNFYQQRVWMYVQSGENPDTWVRLDDEAFFYVVFRVLTDEYALTIVDVDPAGGEITVTGRTVNVTAPLIAPSSFDDDIVAGSTVNITDGALDGWVFERWSGQGSITGTPDWSGLDVSFVMPLDPVSLTAHWRRLNEPINPLIDMYPPVVNFGQGVEIVYTPAGPLDLTVRNRHTAAVGGLGIELTNVTLDGAAIPGGITPFTLNPPGGVSDMSDFEIAARVNDTTPATLVFTVTLAPGLAAGLYEADVILRHGTEEVGGARVRFVAVPMAVVPPEPPGPGDPWIPVLPPVPDGVLYLGIGHQERFLQEDHDRHVPFENVDDTETITGLEVEIVNVQRDPPFTFAGGTEVFEAQFGPFTGGPITEIGPEQIVNLHVRPGDWATWELGRFTATVNVTIDNPLYGEPGEPARIAWGSVDVMFDVVPWEYRVTLQNVGIGAGIADWRDSNTDHFENNPPNATPQRTPIYAFAGEPPLGQQFSHWTFVLDRDTHTSADQGFNDGFTPDNPNDPTTRLVMPYGNLTLIANWEPEDTVDPWIPPLPPVDPNDLYLGVGIEGRYRIAEHDRFRTLTNPTATPITGLNAAISNVQRDALHDGDFTAHSTPTAFAFEFRDMAGAVVAEIPANGSVRLHLFPGAANLEPGRYRANVQVTATGAEGAGEFYVVFDVVPLAYRVTLVNAGAGAEIDGEEVTFRPRDAGEEVEIFAGERDGFTFAGWTFELELDSHPLIGDVGTFTLAAPSSPRTTFVMPFGNVVLTAVWQVEDPTGPVVPPILPPDDADLYLGVGIEGRYEPEDHEYFTVIFNTTDAAVNVSLGNTTGEFTARLSANTIPPGGAVRLYVRPNAGLLFDPPSDVYFNRHRGEVNFIVDSGSPQPVSVAFDVVPLEYRVTLVNTGTGAEINGDARTEAIVRWADSLTVNIDAGTRSGFEFAGWESDLLLDSEGTVHAFALGDPDSPATNFTMPHGHVTLTAIWEFDDTPVGPTEPPIDPQTGDLRLGVGIFGRYDPLDPIHEDSVELIGIQDAAGLEFTVQDILHTVGGATNAIPNVFHVWFNENGDVTLHARPNSPGLAIGLYIANIYVTDNALINEGPFSVVFDVAPYLRYSVILENEGEGATINGRPDTPPNAMDVGEAVTVFAGTRAGYVFAGWEYSISETNPVSGDNTGFSFDQNTARTTFDMPFGNILLTATWERDVSNRVSLVNQGGGAWVNNTPYTGPVAFEQGVEVTVFAGTRAGYDFDGWTYTSDAAGFTIGDLASPAVTFTMPDGNVQLTVAWVLSGPTGPVVPPWPPLEPPLTDDVLNLGTGIEGRYTLGAHTRPVTVPGIPGHALPINVEFEDFTFYDLNGTSATPVPANMFAFTGPSVIPADGSIELLVMPYNTNMAVGIYRGWLRVYFDDSNPENERLLYEREVVFRVVPWRYLVTMTGTGTGAELSGAAYFGPMEFEPGTLVTAFAGARSGYVFTRWDYAVNPSAWLGLDADPTVMFTMPQGNVTLAPVWRHLSEVLIPEPPPVVPPTIEPPPTEPPIGPPIEGPDPVTGELDLGWAFVGYDQARVNSFHTGIFSFTNTAPVDITGLSIGAGSDFELFVLDSGDMTAVAPGFSIDAGETVNFIVRPALGLEVGPYSSAIVLSGGAGEISRFTVRFEVRPRLPNRLELIVRTDAYHERPDGTLTRETRIPLGQRHSGTAISINAFEQNVVELFAAQIMSQPTPHLLDGNMWNVHHWSIDRFEVRPDLTHTIPWPWVISFTMPDEPVEVTAYLRVQYHLYTTGIDGGIGFASQWGGIGIEALQNENVSIARTLQAGNVPGSIFTGWTVHIVEEHITENGRRVPVQGRELTPEEMAFVRLMDDSTLLQRNPLLEWRGLSDVIFRANWAPLFGVTGRASGADVATTTDFPLGPDESLPPGFFPLGSMVTFTMFDEVTGFDRVGLWTLDGEKQDLGEIDNATNSVAVKVTESIDVAFTMSAPVSTRFEGAPLPPEFTGVPRVASELAAEQRVLYGEEVGFTAMLRPMFGFNVAYWLVNGVRYDYGVVLPRIIKADSLLEVIAVLENNQTRTVTFRPEGSGQVTATAEGNPITSPSELPTIYDLVFTAIPDAGYRVAGWRVNGVDRPDITGDTHEETLTMDYDVVVVFEPIPIDTHRVVFGVESGSGSITATAGGVAITSPEDVDVNSRVEFAAVPASGWRVAGWTVNGVFTAGTGTAHVIAAVTRDYNVSVTFEIIPIVTRRVAFGVESGSGSISATANGVAITSPSDVNVNSRVEFTAVPANGWRVAGWTVNGVFTAGTGTAHVIAAVTGDYDVFVRFERVPAVEFPVTFSVGNNRGGQIAAETNPPIVSGALVPQGTTVRFTATPNAGFRVDRWTVNGVDVPFNNTNNLERDILGLTNVVVWFTETGGGGNGGGEGEGHLVTFGADGEGGRIEARRNPPITSGTRVPHGTRVTFTVTLDDDFYIDSLIINGEEVSRGLEWEEIVEADIEVLVSFGGGGGGRPDPERPDPLPVPEYEGTLFHIAYVQGFPDGSVRPDGFTTRAEMAQMFFNLSEDPNKYNHSFTGFADVMPGDWFFTAVSYFANTGALRGDPGGTFRPNDYITNAEFAAFAVRVFDLGRFENGNVIEGFEDHWAAAYINLGFYTGWLRYFGDDYEFHPDAPITRAQAIALINFYTGRIPNRMMLHSEGRPYRFTDLTSEHWAFYEIMEAATPHRFTRRGDVEHWAVE